MQDILDKAKSVVNNTRGAIDAGNKETEGLGAELAAKSEMMGNKPAAPAAPAAPKANPAPWEHVKRAPIKGEKRIPDSDIKDWMKPLGSYAKGTDNVPKTGVYKIHEGEKVVPAKDNKNAVDEAFMGEHSPAEKAHFHRAMSHLHQGGLHRHLGIAEDKPIPMEKKQEAANSDNPHVAAMGRMAVAMHGWKHPGKK